MALILANTVVSDTFRILAIPRIPTPSTISFLMDVLVPPSRQGVCIFQVDTYSTPYNRAFANHSFDDPL